MSKAVAHKNNGNEEKVTIDRENFAVKIISWSRPTVKF